MKNDFDFLTGRENSYLINYQDYLIHKDVVGPLKLLQEAAKKEIGAEIKLISSFRDFKKQASIWNNKASGKREIFDDHDQKVDPTNLSPFELVEKIMRFSALPGASRHHWGCDLDIFDESKLAKEKVNLTPSECGPGDIFCELHEWLDEKIKSNEAFGFYRPYNQDKGGVSPEKWHISYAPLSLEYFEDYTLDIFAKNIADSEIELKSVIEANLEEIFSRFISNIALP